MQTNRHMADVQARIASLREQLETATAYLASLDGAPAAADSNGAAVRHSRKGIGHADSIRAAIQKVIQGITGDITVASVMETAKRAGTPFKREQVSQVLSRMGRSTALVTVVEGAGRRASVYRNK